MSRVVERGAGYRIREATRADAAALAPALRPADIAELRAVGWAEPLTALTASLAASDAAYVVEPTAPSGAAAAAPVCMFGVGAFPDASDVGAPWLVASARVFRLARPFARRSRAWTHRLGARYELLLNVADARNAAHVRWLRWCGFSVIRRLPEFGPERRLFLEFARLSHHRPKEATCAIPSWAY